MMKKLGKLNEDKRMTFKVPASRVARYDLDEIFETINTKAETEEDAKVIMRVYKTPELLWFLKTMYTPDIEWKFGKRLPRWTPSEHERGNTYSTFQHQQNRMNSLIVGRGPKMDEKKARENFLNVMEVIYKEEAKWIAWLIRGKVENRIKFMSRELVEKTFPDLLPKVEENEDNSN